jgi:hypothetical protein
LYLIFYIEKKIDKKNKIKKILYWEKNTLVKKLSKKKRELGINKQQFYLKNMNLTQIKIRI